MAWKPVGGMPPVWDPELGKKSIQGEYIEFKTVETKDVMKGNNAKRNSSLYTIRQNDGSLLSFWGSTVIDMRMQGDGTPENPGVKEGTYIRVTYLGKGKSEKGRSFKNFLIEESDDPENDKKTSREEPEEEESSEPATEEGKKDPF